MSLPSQALTKYPIASVKELLSLSTSLMLVLFSGNLMSFCDRIFLAHYSIEALEGCVSASSLIALFQIPSISIASIAQVFVARHLGRGNLLQVGKSIWQMIWFSLASLLVVIPLGLLLESFYFEGTSIAMFGKIYYRPLLIFNFLFPVGAALASFYIGQGKTKTVLLITLGTHLLNIGLAPLLIFGIKEVIPSFGIYGAAAATIISQFIYCGVFFYLFLQQKNQSRYRTNDYLYDHASFVEAIKTGIPNALSRMVTLATWAGAAQIMLRKGGDYLLVLSVGSSIHLLFSFLNEGIGQGIIPIAAYTLSKK